MAHESLVASNCGLRLALYRAPIPQHKVLAQTPQDRTAFFNFFQNIKEFSWRARQPVQRDDYKSIAWRQGVEGLAELWSVGIFGELSFREDCRGAGVPQFCDLRLSIKVWDLGFPPTERSKTESRISNNFSHVALLP